MVMVMVRVNPNHMYNYYFTALWLHYKYVHNTLQMDALSQVLPKHFHIDVNYQRKTPCRKTGLAEAAHAAVTLRMRTATESETQQLNSADVLQRYTQDVRPGHQCSYRKMHTRSASTFDCSTCVSVDSL